MKPTKILELSGAFKHDPARGRARANEPVPNGPLGRAPTYMSVECKKIWKEILATTVEGVLTEQDRISVELLVTLISKLRSGTLKTPEMAVLSGLLSKMGLTPADRSRVHVEPKKDELSPFSSFVKPISSIKVESRKHDA